MISVFMRYYKPLLFLPVSAFAGIVLSLLGHIFGAISLTPYIVLSSIGGVAFTFIIYCFYRMLGNSIVPVPFNGTRDISNTSELSRHDRYCAKMLLANKKIKPMPILVSQLFILAIAVLCLVAIILFYKEYQPQALFYIEHQYDKGDDGKYLYEQYKNGIGNLSFLISLFPPMFIYSLTIFLRNVYCIRKYTCKICKCYYGFTYHNTENYHSFDKTECKNVNVKNKVGEIRVKSTNEKIGSVYQNSTEQRSRRVFGSSSTEVFGCQYCYNKAKFHESDVYISNWE